MESEETLVPATFEILVLADQDGAAEAKEWHVLDLGGDDTDGAETDTTDAVDDIESRDWGRGGGLWVFRGSWAGDPDDPQGAPVLDGEWRRLTGAELLRWGNGGRMWGDLFTPSFAVLLPVSRMVLTVEDAAAGPMAPGYYLGIACSPSNHGFPITVALLEEGGALPPDEILWSWRVRIDAEG